MAKEKKSAVKAATLAVSIALVAVFTTVVKIPTGGGGYLNCSDVAIAFVAYTLGPITAFIAGGVGAAFADAIGGYAQWVPITFVAHGLEGLFMALILKEGKREFGKKEMWIRKLLAAVVCMVTVAGGYFLLAGTFLYGYPTAAAEIPGNLIQSGVGVVLGLILSEGVKKAYPPVKSLSW